MKVLNRFIRSHYFIYTILVCIGILWFSSVYQQYHSFGLGSISSDGAVAENALWNTINGRFFYQSALSVPTNFREHLNFVQVLYLPFYYVFPHTLTLYALIQVVFVTAGIILYHFAFSKIGRIGALIATALFMFNPLVASQVVGPMHVVAIGGPFFLFMLIAYMKRNLRYFLLWILLLVFLSEFAAPTIFMMGLLAFWDRRSWQWFIAPLVGSAILYIAAKYYITIGFSRHTGLLDHFSLDSLRSIDKLPNRIEFIGDFLKPMMYLLPFFSRYSILLIPSILLAVFIVIPNRLQVGSHIFIFVPAILSIIFIDLAFKWFDWKRKVLYIMVTIGIVISLPLWWNWVNNGGSKYEDTLRTAIIFIRDGGSVTADPLVGSHLARREGFYLPENKKYTDYVVLKLSKNSKDKDKKIGEGGRLADDVMRTGDYIIVFQEGRTLVLIKKDKLIQLLSKPLDEIEKISQADLQVLLKDVPISHDNIANE